MEDPGLLSKIVIGDKNQAIKCFSVSLCASLRALCGKAFPCFSGLIEVEDRYYPTSPASMSCLTLLRNSAATRPLIKRWSAASVIFAMGRISTRPSTTTAVG